MISVIIRNKNEYEYDFCFSTPESLLSSSRKTNRGATGNSGPYFWSVDIFWRIRSISARSSLALEYPGFN